MKLIPSIYMLGVVLSLFNSWVYADAGHDEVAKSQPNENTPRIVTHSDLFELVSIVENGTMTIYLDRYADNSPVTNASIEVEAGSEKGVATTNADGTYKFVSKTFAEPSEIPVTFTINAGDETDLLAGDLVVADAHATDSHDAAKSFANKWLIGIFIVIATLIAGLLIRQRRHQQARTFK